MEKLVRDRIPDLMIASGRSPIFRLAISSERVTLLLAKLQEEAAELAEVPCVEELADVLEVVRAIQGELGILDQQLEAERQKKLGSRGGFERGVVLRLGE